MSFTRLASSRTLDSADDTNAVDIIQIGLPTEAVAGPYFGGSATRPSEGKWLTYDIRLAAHDPPGDQRWSVG
jgi:hypothetical protein